MRGRERREGRKKEKGRKDGRKENNNKPTSYPNPELELPLRGKDRLCSGDKKTGQLPEHTEKSRLPPKYNTQSTGTDLTQIHPTGRTVTPVVSQNTSPGDLKSSTTDARSYIAIYYENIVLVATHHCPYPQ